MRVACDRAIHGVIEFGNTDRRVEELTHAIGEVPSESNPADHPSRELCLRLSLRGRKVTATCVDDVLAELFSDMKIDG